MPKVPVRYRLWWRCPWMLPARRSRGFHMWLWRHGYLSPNFTRKEGACKSGAQIPATLRARAQTQAFNLERLRRRLGRPLRTISWYRDPAYNRQIGGATNSRHMQADAADFSRELVDSVGRTRFLHHAEAVFKDHGIGLYPSGSVHLDSRPGRARWTEW